MTGSSRSRPWAVSFGLATLLFGCASQANPTLSSAPTQWRAGHAISWMDPNASEQNLLYVSDMAENVYVFAYPRGELVGTLTGLIAPLGECADSSGDVF